MPKIELRVSVEDVSGVRVIRVAGPVDHAQYYKLEEAIQTQLDKKQTTLVVDLSELTYISSAGINTLGHAVGQFEKFKGRVCCVRPANTAQWHFFTTIGVDQIFPWVASLDEGIKRVTPA